MIGWQAVSACCWQSHWFQKEGCVKKTLLDIALICI